MALNLSPRKVVPLASGDDPRPRLRTRSTLPSITKRAFLCGVVVEGAGDGPIPEDIQDMIAAFGESIDTESGPTSARSPSSRSANTFTAGTRKLAAANACALAENIKELVATEISYVDRLRSLKLDYADPLRSFAKNKDTSILPAYEANTLFANIDTLLPVNEAFLEDLKLVQLPGGPGVGDVALKHFKISRGFEHYKMYYSKREEAQRLFEAQVKKSSNFVAYMDRVKYAGNSGRNCVGLRELLMEPVQRIPRYTLLFRLMIKHMVPDDPQRAKLVEADEIASNIALAETDENTKRAERMFCLRNSIEGFPPGLLSNSRRFIDCIDVEDVADNGAAYSLGGDVQSMNALHCTLFLFDDKLMIVRRPSDKSGRALAGLDDMDKPAAKAHPLSMKKLKKAQMSCKGVMDVTDVVATDVGGSDMHIFLESPPHDQGDRWSAGYKAHGRAQEQFLESLWTAQAVYRTRSGRPVAIQAEEREVESYAGTKTIARTYFNVYTRSWYLAEEKKPKVVVHIDPMGSGDPIPFGGRSPPYVVIKVQPMPGALSRYEVASNDPDDETESDIVHNDVVPARIVQTIHQYGLFKFSTGRNSMPSTPTATKSRAATFRLDVISRNLFNTRPSSVTNDVFGGSTNSSRRTRTTTSRSSVYTGTMSTAGHGSSLSRFSQAASTLTAATSIEDEPSLRGSKSSRRSRSLSQPNKLVKRPKSPRVDDSISEPESSPSRGKHRPIARSRSEPADMDDDEDDAAILHCAFADPDDQDLEGQLELAQLNGQTHGEQHWAHLNLNEPIDENIYDEEPNVTRPLSRTSRTTRQLPDAPMGMNSRRSPSPRPELSIETRTITPDLHRARSLSRHSSDRRPIGPRTPSPMPPRTPSPMPVRALSPTLSVISPQTYSLGAAPSVEADLAHETTLVNSTQSPGRSPSSLVTPVKPRIPRSKRQPFGHTENMETTPKAERTGVPQTIVPTIEPLSIKKKSSVASSTRSSPSRSRPPSQTTRASPRGKRSGGRKVSSGSPGTISEPLSAVPASSEDAVRLMRLVETTKEDLDSSRRAVKRIRLETERLRSITPAVESSQRAADPFARAASPFGSPIKTRIPRLPDSKSESKDREDRLKEMQMAINRRKAREGIKPLWKQEESSSYSPTPASPGTPTNVQDVADSIDDLLDVADRALEKVAAKDIQPDVERVVALLHQKTSELITAQTQLKSTRVQLETVKALVDHSRDEKDYLFDVFNEELLKMYDDTQLDAEDAWTAMTKDLRDTKKSQKVTAQENSRLKRRIEDMEMQQEEWGALLRAHGLIP
ncbi:uncharacterized protein B0H18DRAFT_1099934 [Fomitopsis serialis]|uniref:uncharacterized protein n=1 Tax=Fomitopsis serialis TaxID=139415 RepID=UPI0020082411|nr:uncharacterized protein B0H18DRAFT_1099934 [Neoantrodia serialis]KAH9938052.1 hypothetical protein B0H18DRAFT_1099934 [Neoantrodia serialis]